VYRRERGRHARGADPDERDPRGQLRVHLPAAESAESRLEAECVEDAEGDQEADEGRAAAAGPCGGHGHQGQEPAGGGEEDRVGGGADCGEQDAQAGGDWRAVQAV